MGSVDVCRSNSFCSSLLTIIIDLSSSWDFLKLRFVFLTHFTCKYLTSNFLIRKYTRVVSTSDFCVRHLYYWVYMMLHTARQARNEDAQQFADRCKALSQKRLCKSNENLAQQIHQENAESLLLATYVASLAGSVGKHVRIFNPHSVQEAVQLALSVQEAEKQEKFNNSFYTKFESSVSLQSKSSSAEYGEGERSRHVGATRTDNRTVQRTAAPKRGNKSTASGTRNAQSKEALRCYECEGLGHFASECPTRIRREREIIPTRQGERIGPNFRDVQGPRAKSHRFRKK